MILLDAGPLGIVTKRRGVPDAEACRAWVARCLRQGALILVPAIAYYEVCRELERMRNTIGLARVEAFCNAVPGRYLPLSDTALRLGCRLWAQARHAGTPTAAPSALDCDVLLAAQALTLDVPVADRIIATTNIGHRAQFGLRSCGRASHCDQVEGRGSHPTATLSPSGSSKRPETAGFLFTS